MKKEEAESLVNKHNEAFSKEGIKIASIRHPTGDRITGRGTKRRTHNDYCILCAFPQGSTQVYSTKESFESNRRALRSEQDKDDLGWW